MFQPLSPEARTVSSGKDVEQEQDQSEDKDQSASNTNLNTIQLGIQNKELTDLKSKDLEYIEQEIQSTNELLEKEEKLTWEDRKHKELFGPPMPVYKPKIVVHHDDTVNYGLNMCFKTAHAFSEDPNQGGGPLAANQPFLSQRWGILGCPPAKQLDLTEYVVASIEDVVFSRFGMDYLKQFPRLDDLAIGSYRINLDYLIFQKQKLHQQSETKNSLIEMSFLKTKGMHQMSKAMTAAMNQQSQKGENDENKNDYSAASKMIFPYYKRLDDSKKHNTLRFDSLFESGNLALAIKVSDKEYNCLLQNDINTNGHTQWFYFKVKSNFTKKTKVNINLINLYKSKSLYQTGMRVCVLDVSKGKEAVAVGKESVRMSLEKPGSLGPKEPQQSAKEALPKWERGCTDIAYVQNCYTTPTCPAGLFSVQFTYEFQKGEQEIYFAHSIPYTYSMLKDYLQTNKVKRHVLCRSLAGNKVEYLHITNQPAAKSKETKLEPEQILEQAESAEGAATKKPKTDKLKTKPKKQSEAPRRPEKKEIQKEVILLTSRVHPGETGASWMIHGLMDALLNPKTEEEKTLVKNLKDHFEFYIIPMLNVDGVINGNYRCSLAACDLNRKWLSPSKATHPAIYYSKKLCQTITENENKQFFLMLDFHGHSVKKNIFQYGNKTENWAPGKKSTSSCCQFQPSVFPMVLSKQFDYFKFSDCTFAMPESKRATARITMFHKLRIPFVFTMEASFAGANQGELAGQHFSSKDLMNVGKHCLAAFWEIKKMQLNKVQIKEINEKALSQAKPSNDDGESDSEGCSSSEEDIEPPVSSKKAKEAIEVIEEEVSPDARPRAALTIIRKEGDSPQPPSPTQSSKSPHSPTRRHFLSQPKGAEDLAHKNLIILKEIPGYENVESSGYGTKPVQARHAAPKADRQLKRKPQATQYQCLTGTCKKCFYCMNSNNVLTEFDLGRRPRGNSMYSKGGMGDKPQEILQQKMVHASIIGPPLDSIDEQIQGATDGDSISHKTHVRAAFMNLQGGLTTELNSLRPTGAITNKVKPSFHKYKRQLQSGKYKGLPEAMERQEHHLVTAHQRHASMGEEAIPPLSSLGPIGNKNPHLQKFLQSSMAPQLPHAAPRITHSNFGPASQMEATQLALMQEQAENLFGLKLTRDQLLEFQKQFNQYQQALVRHKYKTDPVDRRTLAAQEPSISMQPNSIKGSKLRKQSPNATQAYFSSAKPSTKDQPIQIGIMQQVPDNSYSQMQQIQNRSRLLKQDSRRQSHDMENQSSPSSFSKHKKSANLEMISNYEKHSHLQQYPQINPPNSQLQRQTFEPRIKIKTNRQPDIDRIMENRVSIEEFNISKGTDQPLTSEMFNQSIFSVGREQFIPIQQTSKPTCPIEMVIKSRQHASYLGQEGQDAISKIDIRHDQDKQVNSISSKIHQKVKINKSQLGQIKDKNSKERLSLNHFPEIPEFKRTSSKQSKNKNVDLPMIQQLNHQQEEKQVGINSLISRNHIYAIASEDNFSKRKSTETKLDRFQQKPLSGNDDMIRGGYKEFRKINIIQGESQQYINKQTVSYMKPNYMNSSRMVNRPEPRTAVRTPKNRLEFELNTKNFTPNNPKHQDTGSQQKY